jgi:hypothetical protein
MNRTSCRFAFAAAVLALAPVPALANPKPLPFTYGYPTQPQGSLELEQYTDVVPTRVAREAPDGTRDAVTSLRYELQTELEYGLTDRLEFGFYFAFRQMPSADAPFLQFRGVKQRLRLRLAERGAWPVDVGLYLEVAEFHDEIELEEKILLSRQFGRVTLAANLWVEQEWYFQTEETKFIYNPTVGGTFEITPSVLVGLEYWARGRFDDPDTAVAGGEDPSIRTRHYLGPTVMLQRDGPWAALGVYARLDRSWSSIPTGDPYGAVWFRVLLGFDL